METIIIGLFLLFILTVPTCATYFAFKEKNNDFNTGNALTFRKSWQYVYAYMWLLHTVTIAIFLICFMFSQNNIFRFDIEEYVGKFLCFTAWLWMIAIWKITHHTYQKKKENNEWFSILISPAIWGTIACTLLFFYTLNFRTYQVAYEDKDCAVLKISDNIFPLRISSTHAARNIFPEIYLKKGLLFTRIGLYAENEQQKDSTLVNYKNDIAIESYHLTNSKFVRAEGTELITEYGQAELFMDSLTIHYPSLQFYETNADPKNKERIRQAENRIVIGLLQKANPLVVEGEIYQNHIEKPSEKIHFVYVSTHGCTYLNDGNKTDLIKYSPEDQQMIFNKIISSAKWSTRSIHQNDVENQTNYMLQVNNINICNVSTQFEKLPQEIQWLFKKYASQGHTWFCK